MAVPPGAASCTDAIGSDHVAEFPLTATLDFVWYISMSLFYQNFVPPLKKLLTRGFCITLIFSTDEMVYLEKLVNTVLDIMLCLTKSSRILSLMLFTGHRSNWIFLFHWT